MPNELRTQAIMPEAKQPLVSRFRELCLRFSELGELAGVEILPYHEDSNQRFKTLPISHQEAILSVIESSLRFYVSAVESGIDLRAPDLSLVWWGLRQAKLRPLSDLFSQIEKTEVIEVYSLDDRQLFRSFNMFKCISYSLEELFSYEWWELFRRDAFITENLRQVAGLIRGGHDQTIMINSPLHVIEEIFSKRRKRAVMRMKLVSPLFASNGQIAGYLACSQVESVTSMVSGGGLA